MSYPFDFISEFNFVNDEISPGDVIVIPGGSQKQLIARAVELFNQGMAKYILIIGGGNDNITEYDSEAEYFRAIALEMGVPDDKILYCSIGGSIYENAIFSFEKLKSSNIEFKRIIIVCKAFQSRRVLFAYQKIFSSNTEFLVSSVTDNRGITKENWFTNPDHIVKVMGEVAKIGSYFNTSILPMYERTL